MTKTKQILSALIILCMLFAVMPMAAYADEAGGTCGDNLTWKYTSSTKTLTISGTGAMYDYMYDYNYSTSAPWKNFISEIAIINIGEGVTSIGAYTFHNCTALTEVSLPSSLAELGTCVFSGCKALSKVELPEATEIIGESAFSGCTALTSFHITKGIRSIGISAFEGCTGLSAFAVDAANQYFSADTEGNLYNADKTAFLRRPPANAAESFVLPDSVKIIDHAAFEDCTYLKAIEYSPNNVEEIGREAFHSSGLTAARIFAGITYGSDVFWNCQQLKDVVIEEGTSDITTGMFACCTSLEQISIPDSVTYIGSTAFSSCTMLNAVTIGNGVKNINSWTFIDCTALQEIKIPDSTETIGDWAFSGCTTLTTVTIGSGMRDISSYAFEEFYTSSGAAPLENLTVSPENKVYSSEDNVLFNKDKTELILYPAGITDTEYPSRHRMQNI